MYILNHTDPRLHMICNPVDAEKFANDGAELKPIAATLLAKLNDIGCSGLSACQIGINLSMFVMDTGDCERICINPQIVAATVDMKEDVEYCPSFPGLKLKIQRPESVIVRYNTIDGKEKVEQLEGVAARVWLHEYDHTQGICFTNRVSKIKLNMARKRAMKMEKRTKNGL